MPLQGWLQKSWPRARNIAGLHRCVQPSLAAQQRKAGVYSSCSQLQPAADPLHMRLHVSYQALFVCYTMICSL